MIPGAPSVSNENKENDIRLAALAMKGNLSDGIRYLTQTHPMIAVSFYYK